jgi:predicted metal-binding membrane protein
LSGDGALVALLKRDRVVVGGALLVLAALAWTVTIWLSAGMAPQDMPGMDAMPGMMAPAFTPWTAAHALFVFAMWTVMMTGMMTPSAAPMILIYTQVARQAETLGRSFAPAGWFALGYLLAWTGFAALAALAQWALEYLALLSPQMAATSRWFGAGVLIAAGLYQFAPLKDTCLASCRAPLSFVQRHGGFRPDASGSLALGLRHGLYCIGCCWALMALLFVGGVMNLVWIAGLMILVLLEKVLPGGRYLARLVGLLLLAAGAAILAGG